MQLTNLSSTHEYANTLILAADGCVAITVLKLAPAVYRNS